MEEKVRQKPGELPKTLQPDRMLKMSIACRFGWHDWLWGKRSGGGCFQIKTCMKCGRIKDCMT